MSDKIEIPLDMQDVANDLALLAQKHGLTRIKGDFTPPIFNPWTENIHFFWEAGRHGEDGNRIQVTSEYRKTIKVILPHQEDGKNGEN
jgi:hypothetical protein